MIVTVTMNPAIDKTAYVQKLHPGSLNRLQDVRTDVGGKGINVSRTVAALGGSSIATGFLAGASGNVIEQALENAPGIIPDFLHIGGETRTNLKVVGEDGSLTELNERGPLATEADFAALTEKIGRYAGAGTIFVLAGSCAPGIPEDGYRQLIRLMRGSGARVLLDADGPQLAAALGERPNVIKPNAYELCQLFGRSQADEAELIRMGRELTETGIDLVCVSMSESGALFLTKEQVIRVPGLHVEVRSTVGAGDAMVAAISYGLDRNYAPEECVRLAVAASAAACTTSGTNPPDRACVDSLKAQVILQKL